MAPKFFVTHFKNNNIIINKNKFIVYKNNNKYNFKSPLKNEKESFHINIKFKVCDSNEIKKIKILKNNKLLFNNNIYSESALYHVNKKNSSKPLKKFPRSSTYRGVSKNGNKWQVLLMNNRNKYYLGNYNSEEVAAKIYDIFALKFRGKKALTNYFYSDEQISKIFEKNNNNNIIK